MNDNPQISGNKLDAAAAVYDRSKNRRRLEAAEEQRAEILQRFPLSKWPSLPLNAYALGQEGQENNYSRWLENLSRDLGSIRGGNAQKLVIYKHRKRAGWYYPSEFKSHDSAWTALRRDFVAAFAHAAAGEWTSVDALPVLQNGPMLAAKTLHIYYPHDILPIYSAEALRHFLRLAGVSEDQTRDLDRIALNRTLLDALTAGERFRGWTTNEIAFFLFDQFNPKAVGRIVKIAPGENARFWGECLAGGYICVGWSDVGDLNDYETKVDFKAQFSESYSNNYNGNNSTLSRKANELWTLRELEPGDRVIANKGTSQILAVGTVEEPGYEWREDRKEFNHTVRVKWDTSIARAIEPQKHWATVTVAKIPPELYDRFTQIGPIVLPPRVDPVLEDLSSLLREKGQLILYGPPGTGKTYTARRLCEYFLRSENPETEHGPERVGPANTWWVVANPREWKWETLARNGKQTFREGRIRRNYDQLRVGDLIIGYAANPEKRIAALATVTKVPTSVEPTFEIAHVAKVKEGPTYEELTKDRIVSISEPMRYNNQGTLFVLKPREASQILEMIAARDQDIDDKLPGANGVAQLTFLTFHPSYAYEDFIEGIRPYDNGSGSLALQIEPGIFKRVCAEARANRDRPYVVLIDEINRANLGKVFGEIVTLLERDKRDVTVTLPQSKERFSVPPNVYIIGTMNTADRSIKLLDAALRRRFAFHEVMPDADTLQGGRIGRLGLAEFLDGLNSRIIKGAGREKQIGHSFLLEQSSPINSPELFARRFRHEILPLLQEYCYDDYATLASYLGPDLVDVESGALNADNLSDCNALIEALAREFASPAATEASP